MEKNLITEETVCELEANRQRLMAAIEKYDRESFVVTKIHRDDLIQQGFDGSAVSDEDMKQIANLLNTGFMEDSFWYMLDCIAEDMGIPRIDKPDDEDNEDD